jgi:excreted virulence factor EspC (type VII ESX diderm)/uncharacterized protein DUF6507
MQAAAENEVFMNIPQVQGIAKTLSQITETLRSVSKALEMLINVLKSTAFIGMVGGLAEAHFLEIMKRQIDQMADKTEELSKDVSAAVEAYERGDQQGSTKFY